MEISAGSILKLAEIPAKTQVALQSKAQDQVEAVAQEIFKSIENQPAPGAGQKINVTA